MNDNSPATLFERVRSHPENTPSGNTVTEEEIRAFEQRIGASLPGRYREFLLEFGDEGEFLFARMRSLAESEELEAFWEYWGPKLGENSRARYLPIGDDYAGNYYCFDLPEANDQDCPLILVDDLVQDAPSRVERFASLAALIEDGFKQQ